MEYPLATVNACLNSLATILLLAGFIAIKRGDRKLHQRIMVAAVVVSAIFLTCYLIHHAQHGSVKYQGRDWTYTLYLAVLIPHVILAMLMVPAILALLWFAWRGNFDRHKAFAKWVWPVWMFVSVSGVFIYFMLYIYDQRG